MWSAAASAWDDLGRPYPAASARWRQAEALLEAGDREAAAAVAADSAQVARRLGAAWLLREVGTLVARGRLSTPSTDGKALATAADGAGLSGAEELPFGLTPRELQVLTQLSPSPSLDARGHEPRNGDSSERSAAESRSEAEACWCQCG
jgi:hypothetical protein